MKTKFFRSILALLLALMFVFLVSCDITNNATSSITEAETTFSTTATTITTTTSPTSPTEPNEPAEPNGEGADPSINEVKFEITSVTRQDNTRSVITWTYEDGYTYNVYRSVNPNAVFTLIGVSDCGSFMDVRTNMSLRYYYKIEKVKIGEVRGEFTEHARTGYNAQKVTRVHTIMYHNVVSNADIANGDSFDANYTIKDTEFEADLIWLRDNGYNTITSKELWLYLKGEGTLPEKPVIISIDDGDHGIYRNVWPLLKKYNMKADFNVICERIDKSTADVKAGSTSINRSCTWDELKEMEDSGYINVCSHTYGLHKNISDGRLGVMINSGESEIEYAAVIAEDYGKVLDSLGKIKDVPLYIMVYPGSVRNDLTDRVMFENTSYELLFAGERARGTNANYFVEGCDFETQYRVLSRPCRYHNKPISQYITYSERADTNMGIKVS